MKGHITRLIDDRQSGTIAGEDGVDYMFKGGSLMGLTFGALHLGMGVMFTPAGGSKAPQAVSVHPPTK